jgi:hypothetical protein
MSKQISAHFTPQKVLLRGVVAEIKHPLWVTAYAYLVWPLYTATVDWCVSQRISERYLLMAGTMIIHTCAYVGFTGFFLACDHFECLQNFKLHRTKAMAPAPALYLKTLFEAAIGQLVFAPITTYFIYDSFKYFGTPEMTAPLPPFFTLFSMFFFANIVNGWGFYFAHRLLHHKALYPYIHKVNGWA